MDVLPSALPEGFFLEASDDCLTRLSQLVDRGMAILIQKYLSSDSTNAAARSKAEAFLGDPIRQVTFAAELREKGYTELLRNITPLTCSAMLNIQEMQEIKDACDYILANQKYVRDMVPARTKDAYESFLASAPARYRGGIARNRAYFYTPHAHEGSTGLGGVVRRMEDFKIMSRGLEIRILAARSGRPNWGMEVAQI